MADRLNGLLIGGMLNSNPGSLILGSFHLGPFSVVVTTQPPQGGPNRSIEQEKYFLQFKVTLNGNVHHKAYELSKRTAGVMVKLSKLLHKPKVKPTVKITRL